MNRSSRRLAVLIVVPLLVAVFGSHLLSGWLKIKTRASESVTFGSPNGKPPAFRSGSSLADYGIAWDQISKQLDLEIKAWGVAGGSPYEFEQFQKEVPQAKTTFIVVSAYDLDEAYVCDFRAAIVPFWQTVQMLHDTHADWKEAKNVMSQYPITWFRILFPTLGRSRGILGKMREEAMVLFKHRNVSSGTDSGPTLDFGKDNGVDTYKLQRISDWSESQMLGKITAMKTGVQGDPGFKGAKRLAFVRMLKYGLERGRTVVIVLPVSPAYSDELMSPEISGKFEAALADAKHEVPGAEWLRLDELPGLVSNTNFCDLVHMNAFGQNLATEAFQTWLAQTARQP